MPVRPGPALPGADASVLQEVVCGPAGRRASAGGGTARERLAGKSWAGVAACPAWGRRCANDAVFAEPMDSPARPDVAGPQDVVAEEVQPPGGENRCGGSEPCEGEAPWRRGWV